MNKRKLFQVLKKQNHRKIVLIRNSNVKNNRGITLIALVISIIVMLILAGVSLNAVIGDNGIITQAQNATYMQSIVVLEEYLNSYYVEHYEEMANEESKVQALKNLEPNWFFSGAPLGYIVDSDGQIHFFINKEGLPEEIKAQLKGGEAGDKDYSSYSQMKDVYGVTKNLKVYYCSDGKESVLGASEFDNDNPTREVFEAGNAFAKLVKGDEHSTVTAEELKSIKSLTITDADGIDSFNELYNFVSLEEITLKNLNLENVKGIENASKIRYIYLDNCKFQDYSSIGKLTNLQEFYIKNSTNEQVQILCSTDKGIANANLNRLEKFGIFGYEYFSVSSYLSSYYNNNTNKSSITDLSPLANLNDTIRKSIKYLFINNNQINNIDFISNFSNLTFLRVENNNLLTLAPLENINTLIYLHANNNNLGSNEGDLANSETDALAKIINLKNLQLLYLSNNPIKWVSYIKECTNIKWLYLDGCSNMEYEAVSELRNIINNCGENYKISSDYSLALLDENTTILDLSNQELEIDLFETLKNRNKITHLNLANIIFLDNGSKITDTNTITQKINEVLSTMTNMKYLRLWNISYLNNIDFVSNMSNLVELDLRGTAITNLEKLNGLTKLGTLGIDNENINITTIQQTISRLGGTGYWFGFTRGLFCPNWNLISQLSNCTEITKLDLYWHDNRYSNENILDLKNCIKLKTYNIVAFDVNIKLPNSIETADLAYIRILPDFSLCTKLKSLNINNDSTGYASLEAYRKMFNSMKNCTSLTTLNLSRCENLSSLTVFENLQNANVKNLYLGGYQVIYNTSLKNLEGIEYLSSLEKLNISYTSNLIDITAVRNLTNLKELTLNYNNKLTDLSGIENIVSLTKLNAKANSISALLSLQNLINLEEINLEQNLIYDLSSYIDDTGSTVSYRNLEILANLNKNGKLRKLYLAENQNISDWSLLKNIKNWEEYTGW